MPTSPHLVSHGEIVQARERCTARGLPDPGSMRIAKALRFWEVECPGRGREVVGLLEPFYACSGWFPLHQPARDLSAAAGEAVFWRQVRGAVAVTRLNAAAEAMGSSLQARPTEVFASLPGSLALEVAESRREDLGNYLWQALPSHIWDQVGSRVWVGIERQLPENEREQAFDWIWGGLAKTLFVAIAYVLAKETETVQPLVDLWLTGNWPLGFTQDRALLAFCAES